MNEELFRFGAGARLAGILARPAAEREDSERPAVIFIGAGLLHRPGPFRLYVDLARQLAASGVTALRFDLAGMGESRARHEGNAEDAPVDDVREAMDALATEHGIRRFILIGLCSGAEVAHRTAVRDDRVCGFVAMDGYILRTRKFYWRHYLPRVFSLRKWMDFLGNRWQRARARNAVSELPDELESLAFWGGPGPDREQLVNEFNALCARGVRQLQVFSGGSGDCSYETQFFDAFHDVDFRQLVDVRFLPETDHLYVLQADRRRLMHLITDWVGERFLPDPAAGRTRVSTRRPQWTSQPAYLRAPSGSSHPQGPLTGRSNFE